MSSEQEDRLDLEDLEELEEVADLDAEELERFAARAGEGPIVMLNMLKFVPDGGIESYMKYGESVAPLLEKIDAEVVYTGAADEMLIGDEDWDAIAIVRYPTRGAFLDMIQSPEYQAIVHYRTDALERSVLYSTNPVG